MEEKDKGGEKDAKNEEDTDQEMVMYDAVSLKSTRGKGKCHPLTLLCVLSFSFYLPPSFFDSWKYAEVNTVWILSYR